MPYKRGNASRHTGTEKSTLHMNALPNDKEKKAALVADLFAAIESGNLERLTQVVENSGGEVLHRADKPEESKL